MSVDLASRRNFIGSSDISGIMRRNPWVREWDVWIAKMREQEPFETDDTRRGRVLEPVCADIFVQTTGRTLKRHPERRHPDHPELGANVDYMQVSGSGDPEAPSTGYFEAKAPRPETMKVVTEQGLPDYWLMQCLWQSGITRWDWGEIGLLHPVTMREKVFFIEADWNLIEAMQEYALEWWQRHIVNREPPPLQPDTPTIELPTYSGELVVNEDEEFARVVRNYDAAMALEKEANDAKRLLADRLRNLLGDAKQMASPAVGRRILRIQNKGRTGFDHKRLAKLRPLDPITTMTVLAEHTSMGKNSFNALVAELEQEAVLDLDEFRTQGDPYETLRIYNV